MAKVHSHYENLKVARDAPPEVIRAAYRSLSLKYHPDRNPGNVEATRIMAVLNVAYEILSDPVKRQAHDRWIAAAESDQPGDQAPPSKPNPPARHRPFEVDEEKWRQAFEPKKAASQGKSFLLWGGIAALVLIAFANYEPTPPPSGPKPYVATPTPTTPRAYARPSAAPNGQPWPVSSGYIIGYPKERNDGLSMVTIDNTRNDSDVFIKLVSLNGSTAHPVRTFFILAHNSYTLRQVTAGNYDIRYRDLNTGRLSRSEAFSLEETPAYNGRQFSNITITLYKVRNGNMETYDLAEDEF